MSLNRGTYEGKEQEILFVKSYNKNKKNILYEKYNKLFSNLDNIYLTRVTTKQYSKLSQKIVMTRADAYAIEVKDDIKNILDKNDYYLDENILKENNIKYNFVEKSGISIKLADSKNYQILKLTPNSFKTLFQDVELGCGASLFCKKEEELLKNKNLVSGWLCNINDMCNYYSEFNIDKDFILNSKLCKIIKKCAEEKIKNMIDSSKEMQEKIFNGIGLYNEPYTAYYIFKNNKLDNLDKIPYKITTGSGRTKDIYTIVLKP